MTPISARSMPCSLSHAGRASDMTRVSDADTEKPTDTSEQKITETSHRPHKKELSERRPRINYLGDFGPCPCQNSKQRPKHALARCSASVFRLSIPTDASAGTQLELIYSNEGNAPIYGDETIEEKTMLRIDWVRINYIDDHLKTTPRPQPPRLGDTEINIFDNTGLKEKLADRIFAAKADTFRMQDWHVFGRVGMWLFSSQRDLAVPSRSRVSAYDPPYRQRGFRWAFHRPSPSSGQHVCADERLPLAHDNALILPGYVHGHSDDVIVLRLLAYPVNDDHTIDTSQRPLQVAEEEIRIHPVYASARAYNVCQSSGEDGNITICYSYLGAAAFTKFYARLVSDNWEKGCPFLVTGFISVMAENTPAAVPTYLFHASHKVVINGANIPLSNDFLPLVEADCLIIKVELSGRPQHVSDGVDVPLASCKVLVYADANGSFRILRDLNPDLKDSRRCLDLKVVNGVELLFAITRLVK